MQQFHFRELDKYVVDAAGRVRLPTSKQQALIRLALLQGQGSVTVTSVQTYEMALLQIFDQLQRPRRYDCRLLTRFVSADGHHRTLHLGQPAAVRAYGD